MATPASVRTINRHFPVGYHKRARSPLLDIKRRKRAARFSCVDNRYMRQGRASLA
jgi:hypothetical protein